MTQPCGHPDAAIVSSGEGTHYCGVCEMETREPETPTPDATLNARGYGVVSVDNATGVRLLSQYNFFKVTLRDAELVKVSKRVPYARDMAMAAYKVAVSRETNP